MATSDYSETVQTVLFVLGIAVPALVGLIINTKIQWRLEDIQIQLGGRAWDQDWGWLQYASMFDKESFIRENDPPKIVAAKREFIAYRRKVSKWTLRALMFGGVSIVSAFIIRLVSGL